MDLQADIISTYKATIDAAPEAITQIKAYGRATAPLFDKSTEHPFDVLRNLKPLYDTMKAAIHTPAGLQALAIHWATAIAYGYEQTYKYVLNNTPDIKLNATDYSGDPITGIYGIDKDTPSRNKPRHCLPGDRVLLNDMSYHHAKFNHSFTPTDLPIYFCPRTNAGTKVLKNPVGGSSTLDYPCAGPTFFMDMDFEGDDLQAISVPTNSNNVDLSFVNCNIVGGWSPGTGGPNNKWGVLGNLQGRSLIPDGLGWIWLGGSITGIAQEHCNYFHNLQGNILLLAGVFKHCGRTAFQLANRTTEGPDGRGNVFIWDCEITDTCLEQGGGGSAISFNGNHQGLIHIYGTTVSLGCDSSLVGPYNKNITGAFVSTAGQGSAGRPNGDIVIQGCDFQVGQFYPGVGSARRTNVVIADCTSAKIKNTVIKNFPGTAAALEIKTASVTTLPVLIEGCTVLGDILVSGHAYKDPNRDGSGLAALKAAARSDVQVV